MLLWIAAAIVALILTVWARPFRKWLVATRTAIMLLVIVAVLSMLGVAIGQNLPLEAYTRHYGSALGRLIFASGLTDIFHSWYYILFLGALTHSVLACSFARILPLKRSARLRALPVIGSLLTHVSIAIVLAGGVVTALVGFRHPAPEFLSAGEVLWVPEGGFSLRVDAARMELTDDGAVKDYISEVTVIEEGEEIFSRRIEVNHPLVHGGVGVYQYEMLPSALSVESAVVGVVFDEEAGGEDVLGAVPEAGARQAIVLPMGGEVEIAGSGFSLKLLEFRSDFTYDIERGTAELASLKHSNPAVLVQVLSSGDAIDETWLVAGFAGHEGDEAIPFRLFLLDYTPDFESALTRFELSRQPGSPLLFAGFAAMSLGLCLTFWTRRPRLGDSDDRQR